MKHSNAFYLKNNPSSIYTLFLGLKAGQQKTDSENNLVIPELAVHRKNVTIHLKHLQQYAQICDIDDDNMISELYPMMLVYPLNLRLVSLKSFPLNIFSMLNKRTQIFCCRAILPDDVFDIESKIHEIRVMDKGVEVDILSDITAGGMLTWQSVNTFYFRGKFGANGNSQKVGFSPMTDFEKTETWYLKPENGFRYSRLSGDSNGIHYSKTYAKMMGFKRDFVQPMFIAEKCLGRLNECRSDVIKSIDLHYKGQVYYDHNVTLKSLETDIGDRFDLFCDGNDKPCISGSIAYDKGS